MKAPDKHDFLRTNGPDRDWGEGEPDLDLQEPPNPGCKGKEPLSALLSSSSCLRFTAGV